MTQAHPDHDLPPAVRLLGLSGILPQLACIAHTLAFGGSFAGQAGLAYAAVILSFLGGLWLVALCLLASPLVDISLSRRITLPNGWLRLRWQMASGLGLTTLILAALTA